jgi:hypothetical protein
MKAGPIVVTVDIDWACEAAIALTLDWMQERGIRATIFSTHHSARVEEALSTDEVGLHPYFDVTSSHGRTIADVVAHVRRLPHNLAAFRCHRYATSNEAQLAMYDSGMRLSSNVCTDLAIVPPFRTRVGLLEFPIFLEDGGYLLQRHPLHVEDRLLGLLMAPGLKVLTIHPMHFALNTPEFDFMRTIKRSASREEWMAMTATHIQRLQWNGRGVRDLIVDVLSCGISTTTLGTVAQAETRLA